jgi:hypothetical protein
MGPAAGLPSALAVGFAWMTAVVDLLANPAAACAPYARRIRPYLLLDGTLTECERSATAGPTSPTITTDTGQKYRW